MADEVIRFRVTAEGMERSTAQFKTLAGAQATANDNFQKLSQNAQRGATTLGALGGALGRIDPQLAAAGASFGRAGGAISAMTAAIGGPGGLLVGGAIAAIGVFASSLEKAKERSKELAEWQARVAEEASRASEALVKSNEALFTRDRSQLAIQNDILETQRKLAEIGKQGNFQGVPGFGVEIGTSDLTPGQANRLAELQNRMASLRGELTDRQKKDAEEAERRRAEAERRRGDPLFEAMQRRDENDSRIRALQSMQDAPVAETRAENLEGALKNVTEFQKLYEEQKTANTKAEAEKRTSVLEEEARKEQLIASQRAERNAAFTELALDGYRTTASAGVQMFAALAKGDKDARNEMLKSVGSSLIAKGIGWLIEAPVATLLGNPVGPAMIIAGGAAISAGAAMGGEVLGGGGGGGGASGGGAGLNATPIGLSRESGAENTRPINIEINTLESSAELGMRINKSIGEAKRQGMIQ